MHFSARVINLSSGKINTSSAAKDISNGISKAFGNEITIDGKTYTLKTDIDISEVSSVDDVAASDHLFVIADQSDIRIRGVTNEIGGKVIHLNNGDYNGILGNNTKTAVHEFGHALGLEHPDPKSIGYNPSKDVMVQGKDAGNRFTGGDMVRAYDNWRNGRLNKGRNYMTFDGKKLPYPALNNRGYILNIQKVGFSWGRIK